MRADVLIQQKRFIRCLASLRGLEHCRTAFIELNILTIATLYIQEAIIHSVSSPQPRHSDIHHHNTRNASNCALPPYLSDFVKNPFVYHRAKCSTCYLKRTPFPHLKGRLTTWLLERPNYTVKRSSKSAVESFTSFKVVSVFLTL